MAHEVRPDEAAGALTEIARRRAQVVTLTTIPTWFWWAIAVLMIGFAVAVETRRPLVIGIATTAFVLGVLTVTGLFAFGIIQRAQPRNDLLRPKGVLAILGFVAAVLAVSLPTSFALDAAGARYPATVGVLLGGALMVVGGPLLTRYLRRLMLAGNAGNAGDAGYAGGRK
jgi:hypothetical protein